MTPLIRPLLAAALTCLAQPLLASTYTARTPAEVHTYMAAAQPGDEILLAPGNWASPSLNLVANGSEESPIVIRAAVPGRTIFTGQVNIDIGGKWLVLRDIVITNGFSANDVIEFRNSSRSQQAEDCRLTNVAIFGYSPPPALRSLNNKWVSLYGRRNRVDHCYFSGMDNYGNMLTVWPDGQPNDHLIDHNHFADRPVGGDNGWETIRIGTSDVSMTVSRTRVINNYFSECDGEIETISNKSEENVYRGNVFYRCQGMLTLRHGNRCVVDGNFFLGEGRSQTGGVRVIGEDHVVINNHFQDLMGRDGAAVAIYAGVAGSALNGYFAAHGTVVAHNTFHNISGAFISTTAGLGSSGRSVVPDGVTVANNIFSAGNYTGGSVVTGQDVAGYTWTGNVVHGRSTLGVAATGGFTFENPMLAENAAGLFLIGPGTTLAGDAAGGYQVDTDISGQARGDPATPGNLDSPDRAGAVLPVGPADVGPEWLNEARDTSFITLPAGYYGEDEFIADYYWRVYMGVIYAEYFPWVYHFNLGWLYAAGDSSTQLYFDNHLGWLYTGPGIYPVLYSYSKGAWLYYYPASAKPRWFYDYKSKDFLELPPS